MEFVGVWDASQPRCNYRITLKENGEFIAEPKGCSFSAETYRGVWGVHEGKMIWLRDEGVVWPPDINAMDVVDKDFFLLVEQDGSRTKFSRVKEVAVTPAKNEDQSTQLSSDSLPVSQAVITGTSGQKMQSTLLPSNVIDAANAGHQDEVLKQLPGMEGWRTFAKPLPLANGLLLLFQRVLEPNKSRAVIWQIEWNSKKVISFEHPEIKLLNDSNYTVVATAEGLWLLGETSVLLAYDGQQYSLETKFNEPVAVALNDESVLVLGESSRGSGKEKQYRLYQLRLNSSFNPSATSKRIDIVDRGLLSFDGKPNQTGQAYRAPRYGHSAVKLQDGRVLLFGGDATRTLASLIDPASGETIWLPKPVAAMPNERVFGAAQLLPDGRVVVTGAPHLGCYREPSKVRSVDVYDPKADRWSILPPLPFVPCTDAYGAESPVSIALTPNGSIIVGGTLEHQVMVLPIDAKSQTGYANSWKVYGGMSLRRISGVVQALSDREVVIAGGVDTNERGCCSATNGFDRISIVPDKPGKPLALDWIGVGTAMRGQWLFAGGGRRFGFTNSGQMRYSAHAELIDLSTGKAEQLPNIPFATGGAQAIWLDDDRILFKGTKESNDRGFEPDENLSSHVPPSSGAMAIFSRSSGRWSEPFSFPDLDRAQVIAAEGENVLFATSDRLFNLDILTLSLDIGQHIQRERKGGIARLYSPYEGKLILAGGKIQPKTVSVLDSECESRAAEDCKERYSGFGAFEPIAMYESIKLGRGNNLIMSSALSSMWSHNAISSVISRNGVVIVLSQDPQNRHLALAMSNIGDAQWLGMPLPAELSTPSGQGMRYTLAQVPDPRNASYELLFLRQGNIDTDYLDDLIARQTLKVWWWNWHTRNWTAVLQSDGLSGRREPLALGNPLVSREGKPIMSVGWHLREPILWLEQ